MKYIFLDMDNTITESRQKISKEMKKVLSNFKYPFAVISGASKDQIEHQLDGLKCPILAQSGNETPLWTNKLTRNEVREIYNHIKAIFNFTITIFGDLVENRGSQIALSFIGHHSPVEVKKKWDPDQRNRKEILSEVPFKSKTLTVRIAGTTCLDYTSKNGTKGHNVARWIKENKLKKKDCVYIGDALFKGGNDETVIGIIKTIPVKDPAETLMIIKAL